MPKVSYLPADPAASPENVHEARSGQIFSRRLLGRMSAERLGLELKRIRLAHIRQKPRVCRPALRKVHARLAQAQRPVHREPDIGGILILLPVVFPPAHRAKLESLGRLKRPVPTTWTAISVSHIKIDGNRSPLGYARTRSPSCASLRAPPLRISRDLRASCCSRGSG